MCLTLTLSGQIVYGWNLNLPSMHAILRKHVFNIITFWEHYYMSWPRVFTRWALWTERCQIRESKDLASVRHRGFRIKILSEVRLIYHQCDPSFCVLTVVRTHTWLLCDTFVLFVIRIISVCSHMSVWIDLSLILNYYTPLYYMHSQCKNRRQFLSWLAISGF